MSPAGARSSILSMVSLLKNIHRHRRWILYLSIPVLAGDEALELIFKNLEDRMKTVVGTKVNINRKDRSKGKIEIEYYSESELERIVELIETIG